jgi:hypothetical protein
MTTMEIIAFAALIVDIVYVTYFVTKKRNKPPALRKLAVYSLR